ncbi:hypothetical protein BH11PAT4_BH11PAT4_8130 [soil metagenome]
MITLYRATSEQPQTVTADSRAELARLEQERDSGPPGEYMVDAFQRMGKEKYVRLVELRGVIKEQQFFSDNEAQVRANAGSHRYLSVLTIPEEDGAPRVVTEEAMGAVGEKAVPNSTNYAFTGDEIAEHIGNWTMVVKEL